MAGSFYKVDYRKGRTMNMINAAESVLKAQMDELAFEINACVHSQDQPEILDRFFKALSKYERVASQFEILQKIKSQISSDSEDEKQDED